jgi:aminoglycoside phosphotransferase family enzyme/predicted kinase
MNEDQSRIVEFLMQPSTYEQDGVVERMETHISLVFLAGERAYKLKRAVKLPYADFSTCALRLAACEKEIALNSKTAPDLYLGVRRINRDGSGRMSLDGAGVTVDAVVEMKRFDQECLFDRMAAVGTLTPALMTDLAGEIARFHKSAPVVHAESGTANMRGVLDVNAAGFATSHIFDAHMIEAFDGRFRRALEGHRDLLDRRAKAGMVRRCHGDLHLRNICLFDGRPQLFDCIEFNDRIATVDVLYDIAFLLMDLWHRDLPAFANLVMNRYLDETGDEDGFVLLPFFMAVRAAVRAHVTATQAETAGSGKDELTRQARSYFDLALALLNTVSPRLFAIGGLSGSGKTTIAERLAPMVGAPPGARIIESDRIRKAMFGVLPETRLGAEAYRPEISTDVYRKLCSRSHVIAANGGSVIVDAVFDKPQNRAMVEKAARNAGVPFMGIWLDADPAVLRKRVAERKGGPSDADLTVLDGQLRRDVGEIRWRHVRAGDSVDTIIQAILGREPDQAGLQ